MIIFLGARVFVLTLLQGNEKSGQVGNWRGYNVKIANWTFEPNKGLLKLDCVSSVMTELIFVVRSEPNHEFIQTGRQRFCSANVKIISD
jgi:hypothetical protein